MDKVDQLRASLISTFKMIAFVGFIVTGALAAALFYERIYKKLNNYSEEKINKNKWYFYLVAAAIELVFIFLYVLLFKNT